MIEVIPSEFDERKANAAKEWAFDKQARSIKKSRFQSLTAWEKSLKRMKLYPTPVLTDAIDRAIAAGWLGWEQEGIKALQNKPRKLVNQWNQNPLNNKCANGSRSGNFHAVTLRSWNSCTALA
jgi:hypothetical protein